MASRYVIGVALAVFSIAVMPGGGSAAVAQSDPAVPSQIPFDHPDPPPGVQPCYVKSKNCIDLFKEQLENCDAAHPCKGKPKPMPALPQRRGTVDH